MRMLAGRAPLALLLIAVLGCNGEDKSARPASESAARGAMSATATSTPTPRRTRQRKKHATARSKVAKVAPAPSPPAAATPAVFVACDPNIRVKAATTTCPFAENVFYEYFQDTAGYVSATTVRAWSPAARRFFSVACAGREPIVCAAGDGAEVRFSAEAMAAYDDSQAVRYASTHDTGVQSPRPAPKAQDRTDLTTLMPARTQAQTFVRLTTASPTSMKARAPPSNARTGRGRIPASAPALAPGTAGSGRGPRVAGRVDWRIQRTAHAHCC